METSRSDVEDLIRFNPSEDKDVHLWQGNGVQTLSCSEMVQEIVGFQKEFSELRDIDEYLQNIIQVQKEFRKDYARINTDPPPNENREDTRNLLKLLDYLEEIFGKEKIPLLEESIVREGHKIAAKDGCPNAGVFSDRPRYTTYKGKRHDYQMPVYPDTMEKATSRLLIDFNSLYDASMHVCDPAEKLNRLFKTISWFLFEILDLHPFGNGNGRIFRGLCSHLLTPVTPFVSPLYLYHCTADDNNDHSNCQMPCKDVYEQALWDTRTKDGRKPKKILSMIIYSNWKTWKHFLNEIRRQSEVKN